ncbi:MAG: class I SAM-dependent DNA methyltransferase [Flavobacteriales bacterium]|nr:class I SAM-dependent DNA methyltransferase [Flavobacteriales bacterium]
MPLSRREIRTRATRFAKQWANAHNEDADAKPFWIEFFEVFGVRSRTVGSYEVHVKKLSKGDGYIDYFWPGMLLVEHKSKGKDLEKAFIQANDYFQGLKEHEKPRYLLVSDFQRFRLKDLETGTLTELTLEELPQRIEVFDFIAGYEVRTVREQDPVNIRAAELMGRLHDELKATGYDGQPGSPERHALELYLVRLLFILFADDTGIFERDAFYTFITDQSREDGSDLGAQMARLFQLLNTAEDKRPRTLDERLADFKYINGKLFEEQLPLAEWDGAMRVTLLELASLDWGRISPAIFGALFQSAMDPKQRRNLGAHYTSEQNILKLIKPLFLDALWDEFAQVKGSTPKLEKFHQKLSELRFLDPACGCGNFLVITYRELRRLEMEVIRALQKGQQVMDVDHLVRLNVDRFYGIELDEFPAQIAQVALWLTDHQLNQEVSAAFGEYMVRIPLRSSATIANANALRTDWQSLLPVGKRYDFILGNPPFLGHHYQNAEQKEDMDHVMAKIKGHGVLDFVSAWYIKAAELIQGSQTKVGFVSTNSIAQGEQVGLLWNEMFNRYHVKIHFAHQTFRWNNEARGNAAVHCVIIGFAAYDVAVKHLFTYETITSEPTASRVSNINPYLVGGPDLVISNRSEPLCPVPRMVWGNKPTDGGHFLFDDDATKDEFLRQEPNAAKWIRPFLSGGDFINGRQRWCLWLPDISPAELNSLPHVKARVDAVRRERLASKAEATRKKAATPTLFAQVAQPETTFIAVPEVSSERRTYIPMAFLPAEVIVSNTVQLVPNARLYHFGMLTSMMHMAWVAVTCGRMKSDFRYSNTIVYNNFPWPQQPSDEQKAAVEAAAQGVLDARAQFPGSSLADLYDPLTMPPVLLKAHQALDKAVDKCYRPQPFPSDAKRVEYLFELYEEYTKGLLAGEKSKRTKAK